MKIFLLLILIYSKLVFADDTIKTTDLKNQELNNSLNAGPSETLTPEQMTLLKKQTEEIKENQKKANEYLEQLDQEKE